MYARCWQPENPVPEASPFLLIHGLASNAQTWDKVARILVETGANVIAIDQRNHGRSQATESGFDFETVTADIHTLLDQLGWESPILVGQSWGGNVLTEFGARYPGRAKAIVMVDGGFLDIGYGGESWDLIYEKMLPPSVSDFSADVLRKVIKLGHPDWDEEGVDATMANMIVHPDGSLERPLSIEKHMQIAHHLYNQKMDELYKKIEEPVLICAAGPKDAPEGKKAIVLENARQIKQVTIEWFGSTDHDIHIQKPQPLSRTILAWLQSV